MSRSRLGLEHLETRETPTVIAGLDPSFGTGGKVSLNFGNDDRVAAVAFQPDGKIVAVGSWDGGKADFAVARFNPDGSPDTTFGGAGGTFAAGSGKAHVFFGASIISGQEFATSVAIQPDGKIVVAGYSNINTLGGSNDFAVARLLADGSALDTSFGPTSNGKTTINFGNNDKANAVALRADGSGKIVVAGSWDGGNSDYALAQLNSDGKLDTTFGGGSQPAASGKFAFSFGAGPFGKQDFATGVAIQTDGRVVVAGYTNIDTDGGPNDFGVARLNAAGTALDNTFGPAANGKATIDFTFDDKASAVVIQPDGAIVVAGSDDGGFADFAVARLKSDGTTDPTFNPTGAGAVGSAVGRVGFNFGALGVVENANALALQGDGRIVVAGFTALGGVGGNPNNLALARLNADGTLDAGFGTGGKSTIDFGGDDRAGAVAVDPNGRIVVAGFAGASPAGNFALARVVGTVEKGTAVAVGGLTNGSALFFKPNAAGALPAAPTATIAAFGAVTANARTAVGDVNGDGTPDTILVTGPGTPIRVAVVSGKDNTTLLVSPFDPFTGDFPGGGFVAAGDLDGDGRAEFVVTPDQGGGPRVTVFSLNPDGTRAQRANFFGIDDPAFRGGARAALGDVDGDGFPDLAVAAGFGGGPRVAVFDGGTVLGTPTRLLPDFFAFPGTDAVNLRNGVFVAAGDVDGDGKADLAFGGGPGGAPRVFILGGANLAISDVAGAQAAPVANFFVAGNAADRGGARLAVTDADGDGKADVVAGSGEGSPSRVRVYLGKNFAGAGEPATFQDIDPFAATLPGGVFVG